MTSRRESAPSVALFPFLAVLVCAMGALILLLLVMTRRIRAQVELRARQEAAAAVQPAPRALSPAETPAPPPAAVRAPRPQPPRPAVVSAWTPPPVAAIPPKPPPIVIDPTYESRRAAQLRQQELEQRELTRRWEEVLARLSSERAAAAEQLRQKQAALAARQRELEQARQSLVRRQQQAAAHAADPAACAAARARLEERRQTVQHELDAVARQLSDLQRERQTRKAVCYTIVPFDALSGTTRRPIVIDCREDRLVLVSEGIVLTAADLDGFIPHFNPLAAGVRALADSFERIDGQGQVPYILLIVRPEGTIAFYVARLYLQALNLPFGYELVGSDQEFTWPQTDPRLVQTCRQAIDEVLRERSRVVQLARLAGHPEEPVQLRSPRGDFRLEEVERLRQPGRTVQFAGQRIDRDRHTASGSGAPAEGGSERRGLGVLRRGGGDAAAGGGGSDSTPSVSQSTPTSAGGRVGLDARPPSRSAEPTGRGGWMPGAGLGAGRRSDEPIDWRPRLGSGIGIVRNIKVEVSGERLTVQGGSPLSISGEDDLQSLSRLLAGELDRLHDEWGEAPQGFYWNPKLEFAATPEGLSAARKLATAAQAWGLDAQVELPRVPDQRPPPPAGRPTGLAR